MTKRMPLVVHDFGVDLAVHEDFALAAVEVGRIGYAGARIEPQERSVGKAQLAALARRHEHLLPFGSVRGLGVEERDRDQQRDDQHGGDPLRPPDDGRQTAWCGARRNGMADAAAELFERSLRQRRVFAPHLAEQGAEQPVGFGRIAVVGEPLLDADLLAVVAAAVEVIPDFI